MPNEQLKEYLQELDENLLFERFLISAELYEQQKLNESLIPRSIEKIWRFIKEFSKEAKIHIKDLVELFKNKPVFLFFQRLKWDIKKLFELVKQGYHTYKKVFPLLSQWIKKHNVVKWTEEKIKEFDSFLETHPLLKKITGVVCAGLLVYLWLTMSFTGDFRSDFDLTAVLESLRGKFTLQDLFISDAGIQTLLLWTIKNSIGLSFPWPGNAVVQLSVAFFVSAVRLYKKK